MEGFLEEEGVEVELGRVAIVHEEREYLNENGDQ